MDEKPGKPFQFELGSLLWLVLLLAILLGWYTDWTRLKGELDQARVDADNQRIERENRHEYEAMLYHTEIVRLRENLRAMGKAD